MTDQSYRYALHNSRLCTRLSASVVLIVSLALNIATASLCGHHGRDYYNDYLSCVSIAGLSGTVAALLYNGIEFLVIRINKRGFHPGVHIAGDLCLVAWLITASTFDIATNVPDDFYSTGRRSNNLMMGAGVDESVAALLHFVLFVLACVSVHKWRKEPEKILETLKKTSGRNGDITALFPTGPVKWIELKEKCAGVKRFLVYYVQEGEDGASPAYVENEGARCTEGDLKTAGDAELRNFEAKDV